MNGIGSDWIYVCHNNIKYYDVVIDLRDRKRSEVAKALTVMTT
jgi:hypothetical protein